MRVGGLAPPLLAPVRTGAGAAEDLSTFQRMSQFRLANQRMLALRRTVLDAQKLMANARSAGTGRTTTITLKGASLGINDTGTRSTLTSTAQVNAATTSISNRAPTWTGTSTAAITLDGTWNGSVDDTLTFVPSKNATIPTNKGVKIEVYNGAGTRIDNVDVGSNYVPGDPITLSNGLTLRVAAGDLSGGDTTAAIDVRASQGSAIVRSNPLGGQGALDAVLEDPFTVVNGSFTVNGTSISVSTTDSLDDVLARITSAGIGITATYDATTEKVTLTADGVGPSSITLANDTSGLLAALKLGGASTVAGTAPASTRALSSVSAFSTVQNGTITVNGTAVNVDVGSQSLQDVVTALNIPDVTATWSNGRVTVEGSAGTTLEIADTTGLLSVLDIATGTHVAGTEKRKGLSTQHAALAAAAIRKVAAAVDDFLTDQYQGGRVAGGVSRLRSGLRTEFAVALRSEDDRRKGLGGMVFDFGTGLQRGVQHSSSTERRLAKLLDQGDEETLTALLGNRGDEPGLLARLDMFTRRNLAGIEETLAVGGQIDVLA